MRQKLSNGSLEGSTYVFAQGLDSQPRCRIEGVFVESEDAEEEDKIFGTSSDFAPFGATTTSAGNTKSPSASTLGWMPAGRVTQLRWSVPQLLSGEDPPADSGKDEMDGETKTDDLIAKLGFSRGAILDHTALAIRCVEVLRRLCESSASRDAATGGIIRPLPRPRRTISSPFNLPHVVQVSTHPCGIVPVSCMHNLIKGGQFCPFVCLSQLLLTFDPPLVERTASLLLQVVDQNPCLPRIYLTGVFFFILMYTGSNVLPIARFLKATHLLQAEEVGSLHP